MTLSYEQAAAEAAAIQHNIASLNEAAAEGSRRILGVLVMEAAIEKVIPEKPEDTGVAGLVDKLEEAAALVPSLPRPGMYDEVAEQLEKSRLRRELILLDLGLTELADDDFFKDLAVFNITLGDLRETNPPSYRTVLASVMGNYIIRLRRRNTERQNNPTGV